MTLQALIERITVQPSTEFHPTDGQKLALMMIWRTKLALAVHDKMLASGVRRPSQFDFLALREAGIAEKRSVVAYHTLTPLGRMTAHSVAFELAKQFKMHVTHYADSPNGTRVSCPCGWSIFAHKAQTGYATYIARHAAQHVASPASAFRYGDA